MLGHGVIPKMGEAKVQQAFYMSKMTLIQECDFANVEYTYLHWPEFLEFIGRLAQVKYHKSYQDDAWSLPKKIGIVLR